MKTGNENNSLVDKVIANIAEDEKAIEKQDAIIEEAKEQKRETQSRLRDSYRDLSTFVKYASDDQLKRIEELGIETKELKGSLNKVAQLAHDIMLKSSKGEMTNGQLYEAYKKTFKNPEDAYGYGEFNIKCRPLFNSQKLYRVVQEGKPTQEYVIRVNGYKKTAQSASAKAKKPAKKVAKKSK